MKDNIFVGEEARKGLIAGVRKVADAVGRTMGTSGQNSLIQAIEDPGHFPTNDGWQIANAIKLADPIEDMGRRITLEAINRANKESGDGSSTTCVLTAAILEKGMEQLANFSPMEIKRSLEYYIPVVEEHLQKQVREVSVDSLTAVASTSAENPEIGKRIEEIYKKIGKDGVIHWEAGKSPEDSYSISTGFKIEGAGYASRYMCDVDDGGQIQKSARLKDVPVMLYRGKITSAAQFDGVMGMAFNEGTEEVAIFCDEIEPAAVNDFVGTIVKYARQGRKFRIVAIKMPVIWNDEWWEDLEIASGAHIVGPHPAALVTLKNANLTNFGRIGYLTVSADEVYVDGIERLGILASHISQLKEKGDDDSLRRAERLNTKTARYFVGGYSPNAIAYRRMKVEDAINAASCALAEGIIPGGGVALLNVAESLTVRDPGALILKEALEVPFRQILKNGSWEDNRNGENTGIDSRTGKTVDMFKAGIVDSHSVTMNAVRNAIGVAATIITIGNVVLMPRDENPMGPMFPMAQR
ncbi:MAG: hypothetical protein KGI72_05295 [Patescibacteria group bacterium]|nr:hypothetical protein [Patescibacteria group bacterium]MDE2233076.1 hypothetical protein [Patescibacteria group bacterium]